MALLLVDPVINLEFIFQGFTTEFKLEQAWVERDKSTGEYRGSAADVINAIPLNLVGKFGKFSPLS